MTKHIISGVLLMDKPQGMTSQQLVSKIKYLFKSERHDSKKAGHTGTLDPMATGLLPICLGEATKFSHYQLDANKSYQAIIQLGQRTDTGDADGQIIETSEILPINDEQLQHIEQQFLGKQLQTPPMYSALKKDGKKLYELARAGIEIERKAREIEIFSLQLNVLADDKLELNVCCSKGTYVRVLAEDIAKSLHMLGHLVSLRRTATGNFDISQSVTLAHFEQLSLEKRLELLLPVDSCIDFLAKLILDNEKSQRILQGQRLNIKHLANSQHILIDKTQEIRLFNENHQFLGLASLEPSGKLQPIKLVKI